MSPCLPWSDKARHLSMYSNSIRVSGYSPTERFRAIIGAVMRHAEMERKVERGEIASLNRTRDEIVKSKAEKGGLTASSWYLKGKN